MEPRFSGGTVRSILTKLTDLEGLKETMKICNQNIKVSGPTLEPRTSILVSLRQFGDSWRHAQMCVGVE